MVGSSYKGINGDSDMMYDDSAFKIFAVGFLAVYWIPTASYRLYRYVSRCLHKKTPIELAKEDCCGCFACQDRGDKLELKKKSVKNFSVYDFIFVVVTLLLFVASVSVIRANITSDAPFDPFDILGISKSATTKEIKKAYRRLSVIHHPDKNLDDRDAASDRFVKISKAYSALIDEDAGKNWRKYGNPDGPTGTTIEVGLPEWVGNSSKPVLLLYVLFIVVLFPLMVGIWWHKSKQQFNDEIMMSTFFMYLETLRQTKRFRDLLVAFCGSDEFNSLYTSDNEDAIVRLAESLRRAGDVLSKRQRVFEPSLAQNQNVHVMAAYLARIEIPQKLQYVLDGILMRSESLLTSMTDMVGAIARPDCKAAWGQVMQGHTMYLMRLIHIQQCVFQALEERSSVLLQIPHFTEREVKHCTNRNGVTKSIYDIMKMDANGLTSVFRGLSSEQLLDVKAFCDRFPSATLEVEMPKVEGEEDTSVHEGDAVTVRVTLRILRRHGSVFTPCTPQLPFQKEEVWWIWLADQARQCPISVRRLLPKMARGHDETSKRRKFGYDDDDTDDDDVDATDSSDAARKKALERERKKQRDVELARLVADPRVTVFEVLFRFTAPAAGSYSLEVGAACDCYAGTSKCQVMSMHVKEAVQVPEPEPIVDSDEEEDEEESDEEETDAEDDGETNRRRSAENGSAAGGEDDEESEYEYIEVTASESEAGDFDDDDDDDNFGVSAPLRGDPAAH